MIPFLKFVKKNHRSVINLNQLIPKSYSYPGINFIIMPETVKDYTEEHYEDT